MAFDAVPLCYTAYHCIAKIDVKNKQKINQGLVLHISKHNSFKIHILAEFETFNVDLDVPMMLRIGRCIKKERIP